MALPKPSAPSGTKEPQSPFSLANSSAVEDAPATNPQNNSREDSPGESADEITPMVSSHQGSYETRRNYSTTDNTGASKTLLSQFSPSGKGHTTSNGSSQDVSAHGQGRRGAAAGVQQRKGSGRKSKRSPLIGVDGAADEAAEGEAAEANADEDEKNGLGLWWRNFVDKYGSLELDNKGATARDHLALERTFLAWLRTSLAFASIGIAITQLFRLNTTITDREGAVPVPSDGELRLRQLGKPLGATFLGIAILVLLTGGRRYFEGQYWIVRGKFPASRGSVVLVTAVAALLIIVSLVVVVSVSPTQFENAA